MSKKCTVFVGMFLFILAVLLPVHSAGASIGWTQGVDIGAVNQVLWIGGVGSASGDAQVSFNQTQQANEHYRYSNVSARQAARGSLTQTATASGTSPSTARQTATIKGAQDSLAQGWPHPAARGQQDLGVKLDTRLSLPQGVGSVSGTQHFDGLQEQSLTTPLSNSSQSQSVDATQSGSITTQTNVDPLVTNRITIGMHQSHMVNGQ
jgi:hypothetical protein